MKRFSISAIAQNDPIRPSGTCYPDKSQSRMLRRTPPTGNHNSQAIGGEPRHSECHHSKLQIKCLFSSTSTNSEISNIFRRTATKSSSISRTPSIDSRGVQTEDNFDKMANINTINTNNAISTAPPTQSTSLVFGGHFRYGFLSNHCSNLYVLLILHFSPDAIFRSQLSVCSEPANVSVHPVPVDHSGETNTDDVTKQPTTTPSPADNRTHKSQQIDGFKRPTSLSLRADRSETKPTVIDATISARCANETAQPSKQIGIRKKLFRSNSSNLDKKPSSLDSGASTSATDKFQLSNELDKIFVISDIETSNLDDSIQVIDERRMKNMPKSERARLYKSNTIICEEYYRGEPIVDLIDADKSVGNETIVEIVPETHSDSSNKKA